MAETIVETAEAAVEEISEAAEQIQPAEETEPSVPEINELHAEDVDQWLEEDEMLKDPERISRSAQEEDNREKPKSFFHSSK